MKIADLSGEARFALTWTRLQGELPDRAACHEWGDINPIHLHRRRRDGLEAVVCRDCDAETFGRRPFEVHHLGGRSDTAKTPTVEVGASLHAVLTLLQRCFWQSSHEPGSPYAVGFDTGALVAHTLSTEDGR